MLGEMEKPGGAGFGRIVEPGSCALKSVPGRGRDSEDRIHHLMRGILRNKVADGDMGAGVDSVERPESAKFGAGLFGRLQIRAIVAFIGIGRDLPITFDAGSDLVIFECQYVPHGWK